MTHTRRLGVVLSVMVAAACGRLLTETSHADRETQVRASLRSTLHSATPPSFVSRDREGTRLWKREQAFYAQREAAPAWIEDAKPSPQMDSFVSAIQQASADGLDPELYNATLLDEQRREASRGFLTKKGFEPAGAGRLDAWLTYLYLKYSSDLADGISDLATADPAWQIKPEPFDPADYLSRALQTGRVTESLSDLLPQSPQYRALRQLLAGYRAVAQHGGWPSVPPMTRLKPGQRGPAVATVAARLAASGDYGGRVAAASAGAVYDVGLQRAVKRFQARHGLPDTGVVTSADVAQMNVPVERRIRQIELNMERWRWLPRTLGDEYILVNIPEMRLEAWEHDRVVLQMRVVVGKKDTPTPIFTDRMQYVVFSPYWNVPADIVEKETLPEALKDPEFLERTNMEVVDRSGTTVDPASIDLFNLQDYRFRQRPGKANSLGLVKFMFPNRFDVYLHDTPTDSLFARASRLFSHGCVRVEQPEQLAAYVLRDQPEWTGARITEAMHAEEEHTVKLRHDIPVYLGYWTVYLSPDGLAQFREDAYGIDADQTARLAERLRRMRKTAESAVTLARSAS